MRFSSCVALAGATFTAGLCSTCVAFFHPAGVTLHSTSRTTSAAFGAIKPQTNPFEEKAQTPVSRHWTNGGLKMAFELEEGETTNMFDGPAPLVKERDACGVGFIANMKLGGELLQCYSC